LSRVRAESVTKGSSNGSGAPTFYLAMRNLALGELVARARVLLRRADRAGGGLLLQYDDVVLDPERRTVRRGSRPLELTRTEFELLELLLRNAERVVTRREILTRVWGFDFGNSSNSLNVYIGYVRRKLGEPQLVHTVRGVGYVLRKP
jgi:two-component system response regulator MprA